MQEFIRNIPNVFQKNIHIFDILDIAIVTTIIFLAFLFIQKTKASRILKGFMIILFALLISELLNLYTLRWILLGILQYSVIALVVIFQPELRRFLEFLGEGRVKNIFMRQEVEKIRTTANETRKALLEITSLDEGALIAIENNVPLDDFISSGTKINADISGELLSNIFFKNASLHDGGVIIKEDKIVSAGCIFPLSNTRKIGTELGTRHRAGLGLSELSDAYIIIVSEETGNISSAYEGKLERFKSIKEIEKDIHRIFSEKRKKRNALLKLFKRSNKNV